MLTTRLLRSLELKHTKRFVADSLFSHADYPSLLSVSDTLTKFQIENIAVKVDRKKLYELPLPLIAQVSEDGETAFYLISEITAHKVHCYTEEDDLKVLTVIEFYEIWSGICLVVEKSENSKEPNIEQRLGDRRFFKYTGIAAITFFVAWLASSFLLGQSQHNFGVLPYTLLKVSGLFIATLLLWFEVDEFNPTLQNLCSGGQKTNCGAVLNSRYAKLLNGRVSLSLIGFSYFFSSFFCLLINSFSLASLSLLSYLSFLSAPVIAVSIYYQAAVIKQWCKLCVGIQLVLVGEIAVSQAFELYGASLSWVDTTLFLTLALLPVLIWAYLGPLIKKEKHLVLYRRAFTRMKNDPQVFKGLLSKSRKITNSTEGLGISLAHEDAQYNLIKVCNPYCGPCARAHPVLEQLLEAGKINLQILFNTNDESHPGSAPAKHFLALDEKYEKQEHVQKALNDWYLADTKEYNVFMQKYPLNGELKSQKHKLEAMAKWCEVEKISYTPTIFINGHELPKEYRVEDLKDIL
ncbi:MAG: vitamin K epoxide reductase family protein [Bacteroidota bacterium]